MKINLEIIESCCVYAKEQIEDLKTKELVPKMVTRRRLTRASKIAVYLASQVNYNNERIIYGSAFGEFPATDNILKSISVKEPISPTHFQNSVYNTAVSYLSILSNNDKEIMTISSGDKTSKDILKAGAIKTLDGDEILLIVTETLNIENIKEFIDDVEQIECGVALKVKFTSKESNIKLNSSNDLKLPASVVELFNIANQFDKNRTNIIEVDI